MTEFIEKILKDNDYIVCEDCRGTGVVDEFCGHYIEVDCKKCRGRGIISHLNTEKIAKMLQDKCYDLVNHKLVPRNKNDPYNKDEKLGEEMSQDELDFADPDIAQLRADNEQLEARIKELERRLAEEIHYGHRKCVPGNCVSSGTDCPAATKSILYKKPISTKVVVHEVSLKEYNERFL